MKLILFPFFMCIYLSFFATGNIYMDQNHHHHFQSSSYSDSYSDSDHCQRIPYEILYHWRKLDFKFDSMTTRAEMIISKRFIPQNNIITGVKIHGSRLFLSVPRLKCGVPATLVHLPYPEPDKLNSIYWKSPALTPYPNWEMNQLGVCCALQNVHSMEIDPFGRLWAVDVGRVHTFDYPNDKCPPKLVIIDVKTSLVIRSFEFPSGVVSRRTSFLSEIVVGCKSRGDCTAFISDSGDSSIVVYSYMENRAWFVRHSSMKADPNGKRFNIQGKSYEWTQNVNVNGIALSPKDTNFSRLFYSPLSSCQLFSVSTADLEKPGMKNENGNNGNGMDLKDEQITNLGRKPSQSDGMTMDNKGLLYFGQLSQNAVFSWHMNNPNLTMWNQRVLLKNDVDLQWPDSFAFDNKGYVVMTTNRLHKYFSNTLEFYTTNFRVIRFPVGRKSYMFSADPNRNNVQLFDPDSNYFIF